MRVRAIRGAATAPENRAEAILETTRELVETMVSANGVAPDDVISVFLTMTPDLNAAFPAEAVRMIPGWERVPLMCASEIPVPGALPRCIRVMIHCYTARSAEEIRHIYLREARCLRPDLTEGEDRSRMQPSSEGS
ncbi:MAG: chorismate mutase [Alicyclobacillaceae bacterium]|nr:chorismate mutase [Alicyclobacillaceae bacterium]